MIRITSTPSTTTREGMRTFRSVRCACVNLCTHKIVSLLARTCLETARLHPIARKLPLPEL